MNSALSHYLKIVVLLLLPGAVLAVLGYEVAGWAGLGGCAAVYCVFAVSTVVSAEGKVLRQHGAEYISERQAPGLYGLACELSRRAGLPTPALYLIPESTAQLLVTSGSATRSSVVFSRGLLQVLGREELAAVMAHAISRIRGGGVLEMTIAARSAEALISFSNFFRWSHLLPSKVTPFEMRDGIPSDAFLWVLIAPLAAALIRVAASPSRVFLADEASVRLMGNNLPLLAAVRKVEADRAVAPLTSISAATAHLFICNPLSGSGWARLFHTHPPVKERLNRLEAIGHRAVHSTSWQGVRHANR